MHQQTLDTIDVSQVDHVLDVRWANDDPNPKARARVKRHQEEAMAQAYLDALAIMDPVAKKARLHELKLSNAYRPGGSASAYPDTDGQYEGWDARAYAEAAHGEKPSAVAQDKAIKEYEDMIWGKNGKRKQSWRQHQSGIGGGDLGGDGDLVEEEVEDDINRYLPLSDEDVEYPEEYTEGDTNDSDKKIENVHKEVGETPAVTDGGAVGAKEGDALGLLGGYGSDSDG
jgi:hypothetical protein